MPDMKTVEKDELFRNLTGFLKSKGIELKPGSYSRRLRRGCDVLTDAANVTTKTVSRAKAEVDRKLEQLRQSLHDATAPQPTPTGPSTPAEPPKPRQRVTRTQKTRRSKAKTVRSRKA